MSTVPVGEAKPVAAAPAVNGEQEVSAESLIEIAKAVAAVAASQKPAMRTRRENDSTLCPKWFGHGLEVRPMGSPPLLDEPCTTGAGKANLCVHSKWERLATFDGPCACLLCHGWPKPGSP